MAVSTIESGNLTTQFQKKVRREHVREGPFAPYMGTGENFIIQMNKNLKKLSIPLVGKVGGTGKRGSTQLSGSEKALSNFAQTAQPTYKREAVLIDNEENELSEFELFEEARPNLMDWAEELTRDETIQALGAIEAGGTYANYGGTTGAFGAIAATAAQMDTWNTNNGDRMLYGNAKSNRTAGDHTTSLATIDTTNDKMDSGMVSLLRRIAEQSKPLIKPWKIRGVTPFYVLFLGSFSFRDLKEDSTIAQANREARPRDVKNNPIFNAGDLFYDGVIIVEVPDLDVFIDAGDPDSGFNGVWGANATGDSLLTGGNGSSRVGVGFMCGAQAVAFIVGRMLRFNRRKEDDYDFLNGIGVEMKNDIKKTFYNNKQHGIVTSFHSAAADS